MKKVVIIIFFMLATFAVACANDEAAVDVPDVTPLPTEQAEVILTKPPEIISPSPLEQIATDEPPIEDEDWQRIKSSATLLDIGISISEGFEWGTLRQYATRLDDYKSIGINTIRLDAHYRRPSEGIWRMTDDFIALLTIASDKDVKVKFIPQTIKYPPTWMVRNKNTRMEDEIGLLSEHMISYWYEGLHEFCETALRAQLDELKEHNLLHTIGAIHVDLGIFGEAMYVTLLEMGYTHENSPGGNPARLWWFADNAVADFRAKMYEKYTTIEEANNAWSTSYGSFDEVTTLREGEARGRLWEDMLEWYVKTVENFAETQIAMFRRVVDEYYEDMPLILYLVGGSTSQDEWDYSVRTGTASTMIKVGKSTSSSFLVDLAYEYGAIIQQSGIEAPDTLKYVLAYMDRTGKYVPVFCENAPAVFGNDGSLLYGEDNSPRWLIDQLIKYGLVGFDFMLGNRLYERDGVTKNEWFYELAENMDLLRQAISNPVPWTP
jgi:hypothetical protein